MKTMTYKKTEHFEPIAMKCTQEKFESIKLILEELNCEFSSDLYDYFKDERFCYLTNDYNYKKLISSTLCSDEEGRTKHETFNAETFLKACGIVSEPLYQLTAKEIVHAYENPQYLKDTFKDCFETKLEAGKWYKATDFGKLMFCFNGKFGNSITYGFSYNGGFKNKIGVQENEKYEPTTEKEVEEALVKEAEKRYHKNDLIQSLWENRIGNIDLGYKKELVIDKNEFWYGGYLVFRNGIWAEILTPTYTIQEAEEKFNIKIKAV